MKNRPLFFLFVGRLLGLWIILWPTDIQAQTPATETELVIDEGMASEAGPPCQQLIQNPDFDHGYDGWTQNLYLTARYKDETGQEHEGAWFGGAEYVDQYLYQDVTIPAGSSSARLSFLWVFDPGEGIGPGEALTITLRRTDGAVLATLITLDQTSTPRRWQSANFDLSPYIGQTVRFYARATTNASVTSWYLDQIQIFNCGLDYQTYLPMFRK